MFQMEAASISTLHREATHFHEVVSSALQDQEVKNKIILAFLWREVPGAFGMGVRQFKNGTSSRHSMARYVYFFLATRHAPTVCQSDLAGRFKVHRSNVRRGIEAIRNAHEVKHGYELYIEKSNSVEARLLLFLNTAANE